MKRLSFYAFLLCLDHACSRHYRLLSTRKDLPFIAVVCDFCCGEGSSLPCEAVWEIRRNGEHGVDFNIPVSDKKPRLRE